MSEDYDLKKSEKIVGPLYPVILNKDGKVIDGFHRLESDPNWPTLKLDTIDTEEKTLIARPVANWHRRIILRKEKEKWINDLAAFYEKHGLSVRKFVKRGGTGTRVNEIVHKAAEVTGLDESTIRDYISDAYKQMENTPDEQKTRVSAAQVISHYGTSNNPDYGKELVARHREEVKEELKKDPEFIREALGSGILAPEAPKPAVTPEGYHVPTITKEQAEQLKEAVKESKEEDAKRAKAPWFQERVKYTKAFDALIGIRLADIFCPIDGASADNLVWKCHPEINIPETFRLVKDKLAEQIKTKPEG